MVYLPHDYMRTVQVGVIMCVWFLCWYYLPSCMMQLLQNDLEVTKVDLTDILPAATIMVVSVTASTTQG